VRVGSGAPSQHGTTVQVTSGSNAGAPPASWDATLDIDGNAVRVAVTGDASATTFVKIKIRRAYSVALGLPATPPVVGQTLVGRYIADFGYGGGMWIDASGTGNDLTLTGTSVGADLNGRPTVLFNGTSDTAVQAVMALGGTGISVFLAAKYVAGAANKGLCSYSDSVFLGTGIVLDAGPVVAFKALAVGFIDGTTNPTGAWHQLGYTSALSGSGDLWVDNVSEAAIGFIGASVPDSLAFRLGAFDESGLLRYGNVQIAECLVYQGVVSAGDRTNIAAYLTAQWGV
jgi:hypothetical protein